MSIVRELGKTETDVKVIEKASTIFLDDLKVGDFFKYAGKRPHNNKEDPNVYIKINETQGFCLSERVYTTPAKYALLEVATKVSVEVHF